MLLLYFEGSVINSKEFFQTCGSNKLLTFKTSTEHLHSITSLCMPADESYSKWLLHCRQAPLSIVCALSQYFLKIITTNKYSKHFFSQSTSFMSVVMTVTKDKSLESPKKWSQKYAGI